MDLRISMNIKINKEIKKVIIDSLESIRIEFNKRNVLYEHGVDLTNYENEYQKISINLIILILGGFKDEVEWWIYESVKKQYFIKDENGDEIIIDVEKAEDFIEFILSRKF